MNPINSLRSRAARITLGALLLGATAVTAAGQSPAGQGKPEAARAPEKQTIIEAEANTPTYGLAKDALIRSDQRINVITGNWQFAAEQNRDKSFQGGSDYLLAAYTHKHGSWTFNPGVHIDTDKNALLPYVIVCKQTGQGKLTVTTGPSTKRFFVARARYNSQTLDIGTGYKEVDWHKGPRGIEGIAGLHTKNGSRGAWAARSATGPVVAVATANYADIGAIAFARSDMKTHSAYGVVQASFASNGVRMDRSFTPRYGFDLARSLGDQLLHPTAPSTPSYLVNGGRYGTELALRRSPKESYLQGQAGMRIKRFDNGAALYAGAGARYDRKDGALKPAVEGAYEIPIGKGGRVTLEVRAAPQLTAGIRLCKTL